MLSLPDRLSLAVLPTPLERMPRLTEAWGGPTLWVKRDDLTGYGVSGNKIRKLEFHLAAALAVGADTLITCGAAQSNHCRATAIAAARQGLACHLVLRTHDGRPPSELAGNHLLQRLAGATIEFIDPDGWTRRDDVMAAAAERFASDGAVAHVIPEGASDALGMWGYVLAMRELADQLAQLPRAPATIWHAASSGGTTAGIAWAIDRLGLGLHVTACSIGDTSEEMQECVERVWDQALELGGRTPTATIDYVDRYVGLGYGKTSTKELATQAEATALTGLIWDPTYTGKALYGLKREIDSGRFSADDHVVFWHTGGGFAVFAHDFGELLT